LPEFLSDADAFASIDEALQDWDGWEAQNKAASHVFRATDEALVQLSSALSEELVVLDDLPAGTVQAGQRKAHSIVRAAQRFIGHLTFGASVYDSELHQTESLLADCSSVSTELGTLDASRKEAGMRLLISEIARSLFSQKTLRSTHRRRRCSLS
jgi:hypothetical protein